MSLRCLAAGGVLSPPPRRSPCLAAQAAFLGGSAPLSPHPPPRAHPSRLRAAATDAEGRRYTSRERKGEPSSAPPPPPPPPPPPRLSSPTAPALRSRGVADGAARLFTASIKACDNGGALLSLAALHGASFNAINASAALSRLAKLQPVESWKGDARTSALVARAGELLGSMEGQALANTLWAVSKLGVSPEWLPAWVAASERYLQSMKAQELSSCIYALATLQHSPGQRWMDVFWRASLPVLNPTSVGAERFTAQAIANVAWSLAKLGHSPGHEWATRCWAGVARSLESFSPQNLANFLWGTAGWGVDPPNPHSFSVLWSVSPAILRAAPLPHLASILHGVAALLPTSDAFPSPPRPEWFRELESRGTQCLLDSPPPPSLAPRDAANLAWGFATLRRRPRTSFLRPFLSASQLSLPECTPIELSALVWGIGELGVAPGGAWLRAWCARATSLGARSFGEREAANSVWGLSVLFCLGHIDAQSTAIGAAFRCLWDRWQHLLIDDLENASLASRREIRHKGLQTYHEVATALLVPPPPPPLPPLLRDDPSHPHAFAHAPTCDLLFPGAAAEAGEDAAARRARHERLGGPAARAWRSDRAPPPPPPSRPSASSRRAPASSSSAAAVSASQASARTRREVGRLLASMRAVQPRRVPRRRAFYPQPASPSGDDVTGDGSIELCVVCPTSLRRVDVASYRGLRTKPRPTAGAVAPAVAAAAQVAIVVDAPHRFIRNARWEVRGHNGGVERSGSGGDDDESGGSGSDGDTPDAHPSPSPSSPPLSSSLPSPPPSSSGSHLSVLSTAPDASTDAYGNSRDPRLGATVLRDAALAAAGWALAVVRVPEWARLKSDAEKRIYLKEALKRGLGAAARR